MIGTRLDEVDAPRLIRSQYGWWFLGNHTWHLLRPEHVSADGQIVTEAMAFLRRDGAFRERVPSSFSLTVLTATGCNLGCGYCFQNTGLDPTGGSRPTRIDRRLLSSETVKQILQFTELQMKCARLDDLFLLLFGGEPLLNPRGCLQMLEGAGKIGLSTAMMTTNAVLLTESRAKELAAAGLNAAQVTFDGSKRDHDRIRVKRSGSGTFEQIVHNVSMAMEATDLLWNFRVNVSHNNFDRVGELFSELEGRVDPARCTMTFAWVGDAGFGYGNELQYIDRVGDAFVAWSIAAMEAGFRIAKPGMKTTCQICSVPGGRHGAVVNADGVLYSCWQSAGKPSFAVGDIRSGYFDSSEFSDRWVTCGYEYPKPNESLFENFQDQVDGKILDFMYTSGRF